MTETFLVPVYDIYSRECTTLAVKAACASAAVWEALHNSPVLRFAGGPVERCELTEENSVVRDVWHERWRQKAKEGAR
jgi:hypothetical protein